MTALYRGMDRAALDAAYNNSAAVPETAQIMADWERRSDELAAQRPQFLDLRYGPAERNRIDFFAAGSRAPTLLFIHGGYWQMRQKETFRFLAAGPLAHGISVALVGYTLAPQIRLDGIVAEIRTALAWIAARAESFGADPAQLYLSGWSAGGHLTAMCAADSGIKGALAISGIYDLEPVRLCYVNDKLQLDEAEARRNSPLLHLPTTSVPMIVAYGTGELAEMQRQSKEFADAREGTGLPGRGAPLAGHNHFTILEELADPNGKLTSFARELCGR
jgi:arylformamidase